MVKNKVIQAKGKPAKITVAKLRAPQLKALQYLLAASAYLSIIEGVVVPGIPGLRAVPDLVTIHPILPPTVHIHP